MSSLVTAARWEAGLLVAAFGAVTLWKVLQTTDFSDLLRSSDGSLSPGRIQLFVLTILIAVKYLLAVIHDPAHLATIPANEVAVLAGSQGVYLGSKAWSFFGPGSNGSEDA